MSKGHHPRIESHNAKKMQFIGEQDGVSEREFKERVATLLNQYGVVKRAYLARVVYDSAGSEAVALCLVAPNSQAALLLRIGRLFASMFGRDQHLDILFVYGSQEQELAGVCAPFFESIA